MYSTKLLCNWPTSISLNLDKLQEIEALRRIKSYSGGQILLKRSLKGIQMAKLAEADGGEKKDLKNNLFWGEGIVGQRK